MDHLRLLIEINYYVMDYLNQNAVEELTYHHAGHAQYVARAALKIADSYKLSPDETFVLTVASWFHDIGYLEGPENHEARGAEKTKNYLSAIKLPDTAIENICRLILATQRGHEPADNLEMIIRDADLFHLGTKSFEKKNIELYEEAQLLSGKKIDIRDWYTESLEFLKRHKYHTAVCQLDARGRKQQNIQLLQTKLRPENPVLANKEDDQAAAEFKQVDTYFQITSNNSQLLSNMADNKANILITVNSILISAIISFMLRKLSTRDYFFVPVFLILAVSLVSMIFSILATRPKLSRGMFNQKEINLRKVNLLFFGNFYKMKLEKYTEAISIMLRDPEYFHNSLIRDVYFQGVVLGRKYFLLRMAYSIFMLGLILAVLTFALLFLIYGHGANNTLSPN